jgi:hypothetical protein
VATEFAADWGDGSKTQWQTSPRLEHGFSSPLDMHARFLARNSANQTASQVVTFFVGRHDPRVNILNSPLSNEYQNTSFFILGLLATGLAALFGFVRIGRKRRRLERELRELETDYKRLGHDPIAADAMLAERKTRARALFLERKLEDAHASFLERRVDELRQGLRLTEVEKQFDFLPHGLVRGLREMLADARVSEWERTRFLEGLTDDKRLTGAQKAQVRELVERWYARDSNAAN